MAVGQPGEPDAIGTRIRREAQVPPDLAGERVDRAAAELFDEFSRATLSRWLSAGTLTVDGQQVRPRQRLVGGERLVIDAPEAPAEDWATAQALAFDVVFEDEDLLVVNKPPGLVVHPGAGNPDRTLVNGLIARRPELGRLPRAGIVHRLDKDTSGLLAVAGSLKAHTALTRALQAREIERRYLAVAEGRMVAGRDIDAAIGRDPHQRTRQAVREDGRAALTRVRVRERYRRHTLVEAELATGRTHQIRVHMASIGYPLVGDSRYGARGLLPAAAESSVVEVLRRFPRQALHAWRLALSHPVSGEPVALEAALPADLEALVGALRRDTEALGDADD